MNKLIPLSRNWGSLIKLIPSQFPNLIRDILPGMLRGDRGSCNISPCPPKGGTNAEATTPSLPAQEL